MKFFVIRNKRLEEFDKRMELLNRSPKNDFDGMKKSSNAVVEIMEARRNKCQESL